MYPWTIQLLVHNWEVTCFSSVWDGYYSSLLKQKWQNANPLSTHMLCVAIKEAVLHKACWILLSLRHAVHTSPCLRHSSVEQKIGYLRWFYNVPYQLSKCGKHHIFGKRFNVNLVSVRMNTFPLRTCLQSLAVSLGQGKQPSREENFVFPLYMVLFWGSCFFFYQVLWVDRSKFFIIFFSIHLVRKIFCSSRVLWICFCGKTKTTSCLHSY